MPDDVMIDVQNIGKRFGRKTRVEALRDVTLAIQRGSVTAFVGPNGAGKSTLFGVILGFLRPSSGNVTISDDDPRHYVHDNGIGYMPDRFSLPSGWPVGKALDALRQLNGMPAEKTDAALTSFGLDDQRTRKVGELSRGLLQRLGLAHAFAAERELIVLDEPAEGLDPVWRIRLRDRIVDQRSAGRTVLIASHDIAEVERIADRVVILENGAVKDVIDMSAQNRLATAYTITLSHDAAHMTTIFPGAVSIGVGVYQVSVSGMDDLNSRIAALIELGVLITAVTPSSVLEDRVRKAIDS